MRLFKEDWFTTSAMLLVLACLAIGCLIIKGLLEDMEERTALKTNLAAAEDDRAAVLERLDVEHAAASVIVQAIMAANPEDVERVFGKSSVYLLEGYHYTPDGTYLNDGPIVEVDIGSESDQVAWFAVEAYSGQTIFRAFTSPPAPSEF